MGLTSLGLFSSDRIGKFLVCWSLSFSNRAAATGPSSPAQNSKRFFSSVKGGAIVSGARQMPLLAVYPGRRPGKRLPSMPALEGDVREHSRPGPLAFTVGSPFTLAGTERSPPFAAEILVSVR